MLFNSFEFLVFFPIVTILYFVFPHKLRWFLLLAASCIFYMAFIPAYIWILFTLIFVDYWAGIFIERTQGPRRKSFLIISLVSNIGFLAFFKYLGFLNTNLAALAEFLHWNYSLDVLSFALPIGLSFHTFQAMSYTIEVYRGNQKAEKHFGIYALYVMFYPQLVAGPIERPQHLLHQFYDYHKFDYERITNGLKLMAWGLFQKIVIADRLAPFVNVVYGNPQNFEGISLIIATVFFSFQIYCDFSGYSDIAIGAAQVMGFNLMNNFNRPYFAHSVREFWKRWHISLSTWFRDYLYIPLGGNRVAKKRWYLNIMLTFLISGLWHGANWTYAIWGALHGFYMLCSVLTKQFRERLTLAVGLNTRSRIHMCIKVAVTFSLISFAWIFFRAKDLSDAFYIATHLFSGVGRYLVYLLTNLSSANSGKGLLAPITLGHSYTDFVIVISMLFLLIGAHLLQFKGGIRQQLSRSPFWLRWGAYYGLLFCIFFFGELRVKGFIYFQF